MKKFFQTLRQTAKESANGGFLCLSVVFLVIVLCDITHYFLGVYGYVAFRGIKASDLLYFLIIAATITIFLTGIFFLWKMSYPLRHSKKGYV